MSAAAPVAIRLLRRPALLLVLTACTEPPAPSDPLARDAYVRLCTAWDMAYTRLRETGDTLALERAAVREAEMICTGIAEPVPDLEALRRRLEGRGVGGPGEEMP